jgi:hypothetical protein
MRRESESLSLVSLKTGACDGVFDRRVWGPSAGKRGALLLDAMVEKPCSCIRKLGGSRAREVQIHRLLRNRKVTVEELARQAGLRTGALAQGRDVIVIQDTSEIMVAVSKAGQAGFGPVGRGGATRGVLAHAGLCVDSSGAVLGLVDAQVWTRAGGRRVAHRNKRALEEKESQRWLTTCTQALERLSGARSITMVSDAESDIYELFASKPRGVELVVRSARARRLADGGAMAQRLDETVVCGRIERNIPAAPGRKERRATLELRHTLVSLKRPWTLDKTIVAEIAVTAVDVREINAPPGVKPVHWLILTTHAVDGPEQAVRIIDIYRGRFLIEQLFRTLKTAGFNIESMELATPHAFITFTGFALLASATILQLVKARDGRSGQLLEHAFEADEKSTHTQRPRLCLMGDGKTRRMELLLRHARTRNHAKRTRTIQSHQVRNSGRKRCVNLIASSDGRGCPKGGRGT